VRFKDEKNISEDISILIFKKKKKKEDNLTQL